jgi:hypothetical protein
VEAKVPADAIDDAGDDANTDDDSADVLVVASEGTLSGR